MSRSTRLSLVNLAVSLIVAISAIAFFALRDGRIYGLSGESKDQSPSVQDQTTSPSLNSRNLQTVDLDKGTNLEYQSFPEVASGSSSKKYPLPTLPTGKLPPEMEKTISGESVPLPPDLQAQLNSPQAELPDDLKQQLNAPPPELPPDLKAQLSAPPPELPEDIKKALATPPRIVSIDEVNGKK